MPLIRNNEFVENQWVMLDDTDQVPEAGGVVLSFHRLQEEGELLLARGLKLAVAVAHDFEIEQLAPLLDKLDLIVLEFPAFTNGRAYSQARTLRDHLEYKGEIRATGDVLPDQAVLMMRCGFDSFEVSDKVSLETWKECAAILNTNYQRSYAVTGDATREKG